MKINENHENPMATQRQQIICRCKYEAMYFAKELALTPPRWFPNLRDPRCHRAQLGKQSCETQNRKTNMRANTSQNTATLEAILPENTIQIKQSPANKAK